MFLSNGPGDPEPLDYAIETIRGLLGKKPIFGICLGHQLLGLACGAKTFKLKFGHRGANQPVLNLQTGEVEITRRTTALRSRREPRCPTSEVTHLNLNDNTIEGLGIATCRPSACSTTPKPPPARTTATISSAASSTPSSLRRGRSKSQCAAAI